MWTSTKQDLFWCITSVYVTIKLSINSKSCTTFTTDVQNVRHLQRHKHRGAYATASLRFSMTRSSRRSHTSVMCCCNSSTVRIFRRLAPGARPIQYSPQDLDPECWAATATGVSNPASRVSAALGLPSLAHGELVPHPAKRYKMA